MELRIAQLESQLTNNVQPIAQQSFQRNQIQGQTLASVQGTAPSNAMVSFTNTTNPALQRLNQRNIQ